MSTQWEVVGKSNKKLNVPAKKLTKTEKKKFVETAPKIEDVLPLDQIRTLYTALDGGKENKKPQPNVVKEVEKKPKKKPSVMAEKKDQVVKEKALPKSLEIAAKQLDVKELISVVDLNQARFPDVPMLWVKGVAEYLNVRLTHTGNVPLLRPQDTFLSLLPVEARDVLYKAIQKPGQTVMKHFFELCLSSMVTEMSKGNTSVAGFKIMLQLVAANSASDLLENPSKVHSLWNSFQNKQPIGTTILWALGQLGAKDITHGLAVWQELMLPMLEMRNYGIFVVSYLKMLSSIVPRGKALPVDQLMAVMDTAYSPDLNVPVTIRKDLHEAVTALLKKFLDSKPESRLRTLFQPLASRLNPSTTKPLEKELLSTLFSCLKFDPKCFNIWQKIYIDYIDASCKLLQFIRSGYWKDLNVRLLRDCLQSFQSVNQELLKKEPLSDSVRQCQAICQEILPKLQMPVVRKSFPWRFGSSLLALAITGLLMYDIQRHGSFELSSTGLFLRDIGALKYGKQAWGHTRIYLSKGASWAKENVPVYYQTVSEVCGPYLQQVKEVSIVVGGHLNQTYYNVASYVQEKAPLIEQWCDGYAPGLVQTVRTQVGGAWGLIKDCTSWLGDLSMKQSQLVINWARTNVFVGCLSPEKLQQFSQEALNTTQDYAFRTYQWVVRKYYTLASVH